MDFKLYNNEQEVYIKIQRSTGGNAIGGNYMFYVGNTSHNVSSILILSQV